MKREERSPLVRGCKRSDLLCVESVGQCESLTQASHCFLTPRLAPCICATCPRRTPSHLSPRHRESCRRQARRSLRHRRTTCSRYTVAHYLSLLSDRSLMLIPCLSLLGLAVIVSALMDLYSATNGSHWTNNANWLVGDPCANSWANVMCTGGLITDLYEAFASGLHCRLL